MSPSLNPPTTTPRVAAAADDDNTELEEEECDPLNLDIYALNHSLAAKSISHHEDEESKEVRCCCAKDNCPTLIRSKTVLVELERDVQTAASLGKALLKRHELSLHDAATERDRLTETLMMLEDKAKNLEAENSELHEENAKTIEENRKLLSELEQLNSGMHESELRAKELQEDLDAVHAELSRVSVAAANTQILEAQLYALGNEHIELKKLLNNTKEGEKAAVARWKKAERSLSEMSEQLEKLESEHRIEKARAQNLLDRLEKRQLIDRKNGFPSALVERTAMSQFMKEVLAENNHLQSGIAELRDMLLLSQEEVTALREQLLLTIEKTDVDDNQLLSRELLAEKLTALGLPTVAPELHFHHHYHKEKSGIRRLKKRRGVALPEHLKHLAGKGSMDDSQPTSPLTPGPSARSQRWQIPSQSRSSHGRVPSYSSSPGSTFTWRDSLVFDRSTGPDSTRPSTPGSEYEGVPTLSNRHSRHRRQDSANPPFSILYTEEIPEENAEEDGGMITNDTAHQLPAEIPSAARPTLHRSASHESLLSPTTLNAPNTSFPLSSAMASFAPVSPLGLASTSPNSIMASHKPITEAGAAYNHLLLAGGAIRGKSKSAQISAGSGGSRAGWLWSWGASMVRGDSSAATSGGSSPGKIGNETGTGSTISDNNNTPATSSTGGAFPKRRIGTFPIGMGIGFGSLATASAATVTTNANGATSAVTGVSNSSTPTTTSVTSTRDSTPAATMSKHSTVPGIPIPPFRTYVDHDMLRECLMEGFQG